MRSKIPVFFSVFALPVSGCANRQFYDTPDLIPESFAFGEVIGVELVGPRVETPRPWDSEIDRYDQDRQDLLTLRGSDGVVPLTPEGRPPQDYVSDRFWLAGGYAVHTTLVLDNDKEILVIGTQDSGVVPGERVRLGFGNPSSRDEAEQVVLIRLR